MNLIPRKLLLFLIMSIAVSGCVPTLQLKNEASESYFASRNFEDSILEGNRANGVLILVSTGYIQRNNQEQLSIYLQCDFVTPHSARLLAAELVDSNGLRLETSDLGLDCLESYQSTSSLKGSGYLNFHGEDVSKLAFDETLILKVSIEAKDGVYNLSLPLTSAKVWVWPT